MDELGGRVGLEGPQPGLPSERLEWPPAFAEGYVGAHQLPGGKAGQDGGRHHRCGHRHSLSCHMHRTCEGVRGNIKGIALHQLM